ncbi:RNase HII [Rhodoglobus vestalii]|uniref:Ribonuclease n=1 Tax=Rhodoglobus vestalii TaxID=193384 RepID=A0A8H2PY61_9MICO|nr:ribonuclease HII [Rhodoglobus vestalii]TQO20905.1 RNase HII [Rhodoglobus vestalii]
MPVADPTSEVEGELFRTGTHLVIGCDEVGRGAIAGPVAVGMTAMSAAHGPWPAGLRDSKMLSEKRRELLAPLTREWAPLSAVGYADATEIDSIGITAALGLAGKRALIQLHDAGVDVMSSVVLLDGSTDWLSGSLTVAPRVHTRVKADRDCVSVAAASVVAKVHRDRMMIEADTEYPGYHWPSNKGYGSAAHFEAIGRLGATELHRHTWLR